MGPFSKSKNCEYILVAVDYVSKWVEAMPCRVVDAKNSRKMFEEIIFLCFGVLRMVISDGGTHFSTCQNMGSVTTSLHCITLRQAETSNKQIKNILHKMVNEMGTAWKDRLPDAL
jgi:hypothetical protein